MCNPLAVMAGAQIGSTLLQTQQQGQIASAAEQSAQAAARASQDAISAAADQQRMATTDQANQRYIQSMQDEARMLAAAGEHGMGGAGVTGATQEIEFNRSTDIATLAANLGMYDEQVARQRAGVASQLQSRMNEIRRPDWAGAGLQIAGDIYGAYGSSKTPVKTTTAGL